MNIKIDIPHRSACMRAHTATHLLHAELAQLFPQTKQAGSYVGPDELRFDFFTERSLTSEELHHITTTINNLIKENIPISVAEMSYEDAIQTGAKAFFEESYPEVVRVVSIGSGLSVELCGGTHVRDTGQIGAFIITEQTAVAAGIKRIVALTGPRVAHRVSELQTQLDGLAGQLGVTSKQLDTKLEKLVAEQQDNQQKIEQLSRGMIQSLVWHPYSLDGLGLDAQWNFERDIQILGLDFATTVSYLRSLFADRSWLLVSKTGQYALAHPQAKSYIQSHQIKGGGSDGFVQGRDEKVLSLGS